MSMVAILTNAADFTRVLGIHGLIHVFHNNITRIKVLPERMETHRFKNCVLFDTSNFADEMKRREDIVVLDPHMMFTAASSVASVSITPMKLGTGVYEHRVDDVLDLKWSLVDLACGRKPAPQITYHDYGTIVGGVYGTLAGYKQDMFDALAKPPAKVYGHSCNRCTNYNPHAEANQPDGSFVCYSCRQCL
jgi:hypothetical protein